MTKRKTFNLKPYSVEIKKAGAGRAELTIYADSKGGIDYKIVFSIDRWWVGYLVAVLKTFTRWEVKEVQDMQDNFRSLEE